MAACWLKDAGLLSGVDAGVGCGGMGTGKDVCDTDEGLDGGRAGAWTASLVHLELVKAGNGGPGAP